MNGLRSVVAIAVFSLVLAEAAVAQIGPYMFFPNDQTVDIALPTGSQRDGIVGFDGVDPDGMFIEPSDPSITFVEDGSYSRELYVYNDSTVNIDGGSVGSIPQNAGGLNTFGASTVNLTTGSVRRHNAFNDSKFIMSGGTLGSVNGAHDSTLVISGGTVIGDVSIRDRASATVSNASVHSLSSVGGTISMTNGAITQALAGGTDNVASIDLTDVVASGVLQASRNGTLMAIGGSARNVLAASGGKLVADSLSLTGGVTTLGNGEIAVSNTMVGGAIDVGSTNEPGGPTNAVLNMTSGSVAQSILARGNATADLFGVNVAGEVTAESTATIIFNNVMGSGFVTARESGRVNITGGTISREVAARGMDGIVTVASADIQALGAADEGTASITGGQVRGNIVGIDKSTIMMTDASVGGGIGARDHATILLGGGHVLGVATGGAPEGLFATDFGTVHVNGTVIENGAQANVVAELNLRSGRIVGDLLLQGGASAHIGAGFEITEDLRAEGNSVVTIEGGLVGGFLDASGEDTQVSINGGRINDISASGRAKISIQNVTGVPGDDFGPPVYAFGDSEVAITGGEMFRLVALDTAHVAIAGGHFSVGVDAEGDSRLAISGGDIEGGLDVEGTAQVTIRDGTINASHALGSGLEAKGNTFVDIFGGLIDDDIEFRGSSIGSMYGGVVRRFAFLYDDSRFFLHGGTILGIIDQTSSASSSSSLGAGDEPQVAVAGEPNSTIFVHDNATLNVIGMDLEAILVDPNYQGMFSLYQLSGTLAGGTPLHGQYFSIQNGTGASYQLLSVPEPAAITLLLSVPILLRRRTPATRRPQ